MRYVVEYRADNYDEPEAYLVRDTQRENQIVASVNVSDFRAKVPVSDNFIEVRRGLIGAELQALETAVVIAEALYLAVCQGQLK